jgi:hypothetical protein
MGFETIYGKELEHKYKLVRGRDGLTKTSVAVKWLEFDENGRYKADFEDIAVGRSLLMSPFSPSFTWQTTLVTEIVEQREDYIKFRTENSNYELFINYLKYFLIWLGYEFIRPKLIWLWYYLISKGELFK